ncbi:MAG: ATP-dependent DNA helicase RecG [Chloroflexi bacterium]|nr:ATP-dependent DNA helicase RecG [Chloroflexota bacterium]
MSRTQRRDSQTGEALERLRKILTLERSKGYADTAVMGGLDRFLGTLLEHNSLSSELPAARAIRSLPGGGYHSLSPPERRRWLEEALAAGAPPPKDVPAKARPSSPKPARASEQSAGIEAPITVLKGVQAALAARFEKLGVRTVRDLLYLFPRRHNDFASLRRVAELTPGEEETVRVRVWSANEVRLGRIRGTQAEVADESGMMRVVWFNQPFIARQLRTNAEIVLSGRVVIHKGRPTFENPEWEIWEQGEELTHTGRLVPVYPLTTGLSSRMVRRLAHQALDSYGGEISDPLPASLRQRLRLMDAPRAVRQAHYPDSHETLAEARRRLALDEMLPLQISVLLRRRQWQQPGSADALALPQETLGGFLASLPFSLTNAQERSLAQLLDDLSRDVPMSRLLQGDVGSGKTVVAAAGMIAAAASERQAAFMAPTEILAGQHFRTLCGLFGADAEDAPLAEATLPYLDRPLRIALLTGSARARQKSDLYRRIEEAEVDIAVGTHALIQEGLRFARLGFVVIDEQHRFGVMQRAALRSRSKGGDASARSAHMLVMTATPIPRSLYLTLYGDLDVSVIDELPPGRKPIVTRWWSPDRREDAYDFLREQVDAGRQAFVICPLVEESESLQAKAAVQEFERLGSQVFPDLELALVHGRLSGREKDAAMRRFHAGEAQILVSTSVVEVGIDVPNATVMLIEGADRFGLAQLHQFRGRVGRGGDQAYCLLLAESPSLEAQQRLRLMQETTDGFQLAEADLQMRGPGEFFGTRQSGLPDFRVASLLDTRLIELARSEAARLLEEDPELKKPEHAALAQEVARLFREVTGEVH